MTTRKPGNPGQGWRRDRRTENECHVDGGTARIALTSGGSVAAWATVDTADIELVRAHRWILRGKLHPYVVAHPRRDERGYRRTIYLHRLLMGEPEGLQVDHINGDALDNRRANLRVVTNAQNLQNVVRSNHRNVYRDRRQDVGGWFVNMTVGGVRLRSRYMATEEEATAEAVAMRAQHMTHANEERHTRR